MVAHPPTVSTGKATGRTRRTYHGSLRKARLSKSTIQETFATGDEVNTVCEQLEDVLANGGIPRHLALIALISLTLVLMKPDISEEDLQSGVQDVSRFICLLLEGTGTDKTPVVMN